jgi:acyl phosphate:glycerol-3-phosphate acyltransferase
LSLQLAAAAALVAGAYALGSVPFGLLLAKRAAGADPRTRGSGNIGATNVARVAGRAAGVATLVLDAAKGLLPVLVALRLAAPWLAASMAGEHDVDGQALILAWLPAATGAAAFMGHCFPMWLRFRGGKGVATALGVMVVLAPWAALAGLVTFAALVSVFRISSVGSMAGVTLAVPVAYLTAGAAPAALAAFMCVVVIARHSENIRRLVAGRENRIP